MFRASWMSLDKSENLLNIYVLNNFIVTHEGHHYIIVKTSIYSITKQPASSTYGHTTNLTSYFKLPGRANECKAMV